MLKTVAMLLSVNLRNRGWDSAVARKWKKLLGVPNGELDEVEDGSIFFLRLMTVLIMSS